MDLDTKVVTAIVASIQFMKRRHAYASRLLEEREREREMERHRERRDVRLFCARDLRWPSQKWLARDIRADAKRAERSHRHHLR